MYFVPLTNFSQYAILMTQGKGHRLTGTQAQAQTDNKQKTPVSGESQRLAGDRCLFLHIKQKCRVKKQVAYYDIKSNLFQCSKQKTQGNTKKTSMKIKNEKKRLFHCTSKALGIDFALVCASGYPVKRYVV